MNPWLPAVGMGTALAGGGLAAGAMWIAARKQVHRWLPGLVLRRNAARDWRDRPVHVFLAVCDHYEPEWGRPSRAVALDRVRAWTDAYPRQFEDIADSRGRSPQHTFFFPADEYRPEYLDELRTLCDSGRGDVDIHLHHDHDTPTGLTETLSSFRDTLVNRHGLLRVDPRTGAPAYGFIHGNWSLCNSRPDGRWCGVDQELGILRDTGCYADFTLPSAPSPTQTRIVNSIYHASDIPGRRGSHNFGVPARVGTPPPAGSLPLIQGPLALNWRSRKHGLLPRIENADLTWRNPPSLARFQLWCDAGVHVQGRPDWLFVKLHTHGCQPDNQRMWLDGTARAFHQALAKHAANWPGLRYHYVTAWEMAQLVRQAEAGRTQPDFESLETSTPQICGV
jgi:hypothetical protein